ncbi:hypothetical protein I653_04725 [Bacillus subtilis subsp. subtilis str. BAB-1]|nr:hypothetical protein I653_04725 [Bacillus subtilis subsp. subtilis str. BAB-1]
MTCKQKTCTQLGACFQLVEKTMFFLQAFLLCAVSLDFQLISKTEKELPHT